MTKNVVVLGGGPAGLATAHKLLKRTLPNVADLKVTLVSPSTHLFWVPAGVRGVIPGEFADDVLFKPFQPGFSKYTAAQFEFVEGTATGLDPANNAVQVEARGKGIQTLNYDHLVIATGSRASAPGLPYKTLGSHQETLDKWHDLQSKVEAAKSIVIAGGGATGIETAGEIAFKYGSKKEITLVNSADVLLKGLLPSVSKTAEDSLRKLGVKVVNGATVTTPFENNGAVNGVTLSNGETIAADLYLPLIGVRPNTQFVPKEFHDKAKGDGSLAQENTLRVAGTKNVWAVGDVGRLETKQVARVGPQIAHLWKNLDAILRGNEAGVTDYKSSEKPMIFVTTGKKTGTGQIGGFKVFGWIVAMAKGKTLFTDKVQGLVDGEYLTMTSL